MIGIYHRSNALTFLGIVAACVGISLALRGLTGYGMLCLVICGVCDLFDGTFARGFSRDDRQKRYGVQLDSLADVLSFGVLPVVLPAGLGMHWGMGLGVSVIYLLAVINRLAFFNVMVEEEAQRDTPVSFYRGLPVTYAALVVPLVWLLFSGWGPGLRNGALVAALLCLAGLYVLDVRIPKPKKAASVFLAVAAAALMAGILFLEYRMGM